MNARKPQVGLFIPPPLGLDESTSTSQAGIGRVSNGVHTRISQRICESKLNILTDLNFRDAITINNTVRFEGYNELDIDNYIWYCEIDRTPCSYDLTTLKNISKCIPVTRDPNRYEMALDKHTSFWMLRKIGLPVADSILVNSNNIHVAEKIIRTWGLFLLKPRRGGYGKGVTLFDNYESVRDALEFMQSTTSQIGSDGFHIERFYDNDISLWLSVTVIDGIIVYGYRKKAERFSPLGNGKYKVYSKDEVRGGVEYCIVPENVKTLAIMAYNALGIEVIGLDFIMHNSSPIIIDVNTFPGMYDDLFDEAGINGGDIFFGMLEKKLGVVEK